MPSTIIHESHPCSHVPSGSTRQPSVASAMPSFIHLSIVAIDGLRVVFRVVSIVLLPGSAVGQFPRAGREPLDCRCRTIGPVPSGEGRVGGGQSQQSSQTIWPLTSADSGRGWA